MRSLYDERMEEADYILTRSAPRTFYDSLRAYRCSTAMTVSAWMSVVSWLGVLVLLVCRALRLF